MSLLRLLPLAMTMTLLLPAVARAQAEPAPPEYVPPGHTAPAERTPIPPNEPTPIPVAQPRWHLGLQARLVMPLAELPTGLPLVGWGGGVDFSRALLLLGPVRLGVGGDFAYSRFQSDKQTQNPFVSNSQYVSHMTFAARLVLDGIFGRARPFVAAGGGMSVARYRDPPAQAQQLAVELDRVVPLVQVALGVGIEVAPHVEVGLAAQGDITFSNDGVGAPARRPFSPGLFSAHFTLGFRF